MKSENITETYTTYPDRILRWFELQRIPLCMFRYTGPRHGYSQDQVWFGPLAENIKGRFPELVIEKDGSPEIDMERLFNHVGVPYTGGIYRVQHYTANLIL